MIDSNLAALAECDDISYFFGTLIYGCDTCDIVIVLKGIHDCLKSFDILVHLIALCLKCLKCIPSRDLDLHSIAQNKDHIILARRIVDIGEH